MRRRALKYDPASDPDFNQIADALAGLIVRRELYMTAAIYLLRRKIVDRAMRSAGYRGSRASRLLGLTKRAMHHYFGNHRLKR